MYFFLSYLYRDFGYTNYYITTSHGIVFYIIKPFYSLRMIIDGNGNRSFTAG